MLVDRWTDRDPVADGRVLVEACAPSAWSALEPPCPSQFLREPPRPADRTCIPRQPLLPSADGSGLPDWHTALLGVILNFSSLPAWRTVLVSHIHW